MGSFQQKLACAAGRSNPRACFAAGKLFLKSDKPLWLLFSFSSSCLILGGDGSFGSFLETTVLSGTLPVLESQERTLQTPLLQIQSSHVLGPFLVAQPLRPIS